ncbi:hypothetical protein, partial [Pseudomonas syringae group genomosp. 7]|uniref:hypothetical protein n=1 Tax=Pseudomonas syringae group genomosp. 7 TaxID=251699 RepID=UPI00376FDAC7
WCGLCCVCGFLVGVFCGVVLVVFGVGFVGGVGWVVCGFGWGFWVGCWWGRVLGCWWCGLLWSSGVMCVLLIGLGLGGSDISGVLATVVA